MCVHSVLEAIFWREHARGDDVRLRCHELQGVDAEDSPHSASLRIKQYQLIEQEYYDLHFWILFNIIITAGYIELNLKINEYEMFCVCVVQISPTADGQ